MDASLISGERFVFTTRKHWAALVTDSGWAILMVLGSFVLAWDPARQHQWRARLLASDHRDDQAGAILRRLWLDRLQRRCVAHGRVRGDESARAWPRGTDPQPQHRYPADVAF